LLGDLLKRDFVFLDNANGWILMKNGLKPGQRPDIMNITAPAVVESLHRRVVEAGSDIVCTNTFGANAKTLKDTGYSVREIIEAAVGITKRAAAGKALVALDIGPIGEFMRPFGKLTFDESYTIYREQALAAEAAGADLAVVETMSDLYEMKAALRAINENTGLPIFVMMTFDKSGRTFTGCRPESFAITAERLGAAAVGINCSLAPSEIYPIAERIAASTDLPLIVKPNAGLPNSVTGDYDIGPEEFARQMTAFTKLGVKIVGGCCGTSPDYIRAIRASFEALKPAVFARDPGLRICSSLQIEDIGSLPLNDLGIKDLTPQQIIDDALEQSDIGGAVVTVSLPGSLSPENAAHIIHSIQTQCACPLILISDDRDVLSAALCEIPGSPAIRSAALHGETLREIALKYGAVALI
jgi:5-methyltetrahydrofolate--homocysteine methyltransferase